jgi:hypothetical protein
MFEPFSPQAFSRKIINTVPMLWIWIRVDIFRLDMDPGGPQYSTKKEKIEKFNILQCWMFSFEGLNVIHEGLGS